MAFIHSRGLYNNILIIGLNYSIYIGCHFVDGYKLKVEGNKAHRFLMRLLEDACCNFRSAAAVDTQARGRALDQDRR
jgi:hypothetical protein